MDPNQAQHFVGSDLDPNCLTLCKMSLFSENQHQSEIL